MPGRSQVLALWDASEAKQQICEAGGVCDTAMPSRGWRHRRSGRGAALARPLFLGRLHRRREASRRVPAGPVFEQRGAARLHACGAQRRSAPPSPGAHPVSYSPSSLVSSPSASPATPPPRPGAASRSPPNTVAARTTTSEITRTLSRALPNTRVRGLLPWNEAAARDQTPITQASPHLTLSLPTCRIRGSGPPVAPYPPDGYHASEG